MAYRIVPVFPQVDTLIGQAMERIVSKQMSAADSMRQAQSSAIADLKRAGVRALGRRMAQGREGETDETRMPAARAAFPPGTFSTS